MAATTYGLSALTFGVPTITGYVTQSLDLTNTAANAVEIHNEVGNRVVSRYDDQTWTGSFEAYINGATLPVAGGVITVNAIKYEVVSVDKKAANKEFTKASIKVKVSENISLSAY